MSLDHFPYRIQLLWSSFDNCWIAEVPDLLYCAATGPTPAEAVAALEDAIVRYRALARSKGLTPPPPSGQIDADRRLGRLFV
nr:type II toxin-antitoxin system HicB family antitoxin [Azospirillum sp. 412522]